MAIKVPGWARAVTGVAFWELPGGQSVVEGIVNTTIARSGGAPFLEDQVVVEVRGQPGVTKQQLYFLALAAANGIVRRFGNLSSVTPAYGKIMIEYDAADHWVRASIEYRWSMYAEVAIKGGVGGAGPLVEDSIANMAVYRGPSCDVVGGDFDFQTPEAGRAGFFRLPTAVPNLPFKGQTILTACPKVMPPNPKAIDVDPVPSFPVENTGVEIDSPNPKPPGDNRSRGAVIRSASDGGSEGGTKVPGPTPIAYKAKCCDKLRLLIPLVYAALSGPATNNKTTYPFPTAGATGF